MRLGLSGFKLKESVLLRTSGDKSPQDLQGLLLILILMIIELTIIFFFLKGTIEDLPVYFYILLFGLPLFIFFIVFASVTPKVFMVRVENCKMEIGWIKNLLFKKRQVIKCNEIKRMAVLYFKDEILLEVFTDKEKPVYITFSLSGLNRIKEVAKLFLNMAYILNFHTYGAKVLGDTGFAISFSKGYEKKREVEEGIQDVVFEEVLQEINLKELNIPYVRIKNFNPMKVVLYRGVSLYDIQRFFVILVVIPFSIIAILIGEDAPQKYLGLFLVLGISIFVIYLLKDLITPIKLEISRELVTVRKLFLKKEFPGYQIERIEIKAKRIRKIATYVFHVYSILKNGKKIQLFFTEVPDEKEKVLKTKKDLNILGSYLQKTLGIPFVIEEEKNPF